MEKYSEIQITLATITAAFLASLAWPVAYSFMLEIWCVAYGIFIT